MGIMCALLYWSSIFLDLMLSFFQSECLVKMLNAVKNERLNDQI